MRAPFAIFFLSALGQFWPLPSSVPMFSAATQITPRKVDYPLQLCSLVFLSRGLQSLFPFHRQIWKLLDFGLVQTVDNRVLSLSDKNFLHLNQSSGHNSDNTISDLPFEDP